MDTETYPKTDYFNVLGEADVDSLVERIKGIPDDVWAFENENKPNKFSALKDARHIVFRFINGFDHLYDYHDKDIWADWQEDISRLMCQAAEYLGYKEYAFPRVMLAKLPAGGAIIPHVDAKASYFIHKIHIPLTTNPNTMFYVDEQSMQMPKGKVIEVNNKRRHAAKNDGSTDRVHLIFECYNMADYGKNDLVQKRPFSKVR